jgi:hypothetical protein
MIAPSIATIPEVSNEVMKSHIWREEWLELFVDRCVMAEYYLLPPFRMNPVVWRFRADLFSDLLP